MVTVELTANEVHLAASHGVLRRYEKLAGKRGDRIQKMQSDWVNEIEGACAELAWAKHREQFWTGVSALKANDGVGVEIRWTRHADGGLIVYEHDDDNAVFILAKGFAPQYKFVGWMRGREAKAASNRTNFGLLVPAGKLHAMPQAVAR